MLYIYDGRIYSNYEPHLLEAIRIQEPMMYRECKNSGGTAAHHNIVLTAEATTKEGNPKGILALSPALKNDILEGQNKSIYLEEFHLERIAKGIKRISPIKTIGQETEGKLCLDDCVIEFNKNGVIEHPHSPERIFTSFISIKYKTPAWEYQNYYNRFNGFILDWANGNKGRARLLKQVMGACIRNEQGAGKLFLIINETNDFKGAGNGKSTFKIMIESLVGHGKYSGLSLEKIAKDNHELANIVGKFVNYADDNSDVYIENSGVIKSIATGATIAINPKGQPTYTAMVTTTLIVNCNDLPRFRDTSQGMRDRFIVIPFGARFRGVAGIEIEESEMRAMFNSELGRRALLEIAIEGLIDLLKNGYVLDDATQAFTDSGFEENTTSVDNVLAYIIYMEDSIRVDENDITAWRYWFGKSIPDEYRNYALWCEENGYKKVTNANFSKSFYKHRHQYDGKKPEFKRVNGKRIRHFTTKDGTVPLAPDSPNPFDTVDTYEVNT